MSDFWFFFVAGATTTAVGIAISIPIGFVLGKLKGMFEAVEIVERGRRGEMRR